MDPLSPVSFWPSPWIISRAIPNFPLVHEIAANSAYAWIMVLEHTRALEQSWMTPQLIRQDTWKSQSNILLGANENKKGNGKGKAKKVRADVYDCETAHGGMDKLGSGRIILYTSIGIEHHSFREQSNVRNGGIKPARTPRSRRKSKRLAHSDDDEQNVKSSKRAKSSTSKQADSKATKSKTASTSTKASKAEKKRPKPDSKTDEEDAKERSQKKAVRTSTKQCK